ncbi:(2Fe-2S)-binding protein [Bacterioplanoides sp.]|uniref:(2Fe-2S)-binding protein n=1 Tax=Bacterioplanoides sp. TaxID=2066072 RepID=UPI003AFFDC1E
MQRLYQAAEYSPWLRVYPTRDAEQGVLLSPGSGSAKAAMQQLHSQLAQSYSSAGKVYWANRLWALLYWQPVYLAVSSLHYEHVVIDFLAFEQFIQGTSISGFRPLTVLSLSTQPSGHTCISADQRIIQQAESLNALLQEYLTCLQSITRISELNARGLVADALLTAINQQALSDQQKQQAAEQWLTAMQLYDREGIPLSALNYAPGTSSPLLLQRRSCCMHYLRDRHDICRSCPKQPESKKWQRMLQP